MGVMTNGHNLLHKCETGYDLRVIFYKKKKEKEYKVWSIYLTEYRIKLRWEVFVRLWSLQNITPTYVQNERWYIIKSYTVVVCLGICIYHFILPDLSTDIAEKLSM